MGEEGGKGTGGDGKRTGGNENERGGGRDLKVQEEGGDRKGTKEGWRLEEGWRLQEGWRLEEG